jgi:hypothetical protein
MASLDQADAHSMTNVAAIRELVSQLQLPDRGLHWLAESCFELAVRQGSLEVTDWVGAGFPTVGAFRSFLSRLISIGRRETQKDLDPYRDHFRIQRSFHNEAMTLEVHIANTMSDHSLSISTVPVLTRTDSHALHSHKDVRVPVVAQ